MGYGGITQKYFRAPLFGTEAPPQGLWRWEAQNLS